MNFDFMYIKNGDTGKVCNFCLISVSEKLDLLIWDFLFKHSSWVWVKKNLSLKYLHTPTVYWWKKVHWDTYRLIDFLQTLCQASYYQGETITADLYQAYFDLLFIDSWMSRLRAGATWKLKVIEKHEKLFILRVDFR